MTERKGKKEDGANERRKDVSLKDDRLSWGKQHNIRGKRGEERQIMKDMLDKN